MPKLKTHLIIQKQQKQKEEEEDKLIELLLFLIFFDLIAFLWEVSIFFMLLYVEGMKLDTRL